MTVSKARQTAHIVETVTALQTVLNTHTHAISDVTNLQSALDDKSDVTHNHDTDYAASSHTHTIANITGLQTALDSKASSAHNHDGTYQPVGSYASATHNHDTDYADINHNHDSAYASVSHNHDSDYADINHNHDTDYAALSHTPTIANVTGLQTALDSKASSTHNHDADYADINHNHDTAYASASHNHDTDYAALAHTHTIADVTGLQTALDGKASSTHNHNADYSAINHNHDTDYAAINHNHDTVYAGISHNHDTAYQAVGSGVLSAGTYGSTSNQQKIDTITLDAEGHVTAIVTDDSTTLHTMHDDHGNTRHLRDYEHFKFSDGSGIDVTLTTTNSGASTDPHILTIEHADTSSQASSSNSGATVVQSVGVDGFGHVTSLATQSISASLIGAAATNHNHDSDYAAANHNHDTDYAALSHTHTIANVTGLQTALDGKAASTHNHDGTYLQDLSDDTSPTLGGALDANSNSITGITNLSATSLVLGSTGSLISSANWSQNGTVSLTGMGSNGLEITTAAIGTNTAQIKFSDTGNSHVATIGLSDSTANVFKIEAEKLNGSGQYALLEKDASGNLVFRDSGNQNESRLTTNNIWQLGYTGAHNGTDLVNGNDTGFQVNGAIGQAVLGSTHGTCMKIASHSQTTPTMIHFYKGGSTVGTITVSSGGTTSYNTTSDLRVKSQVKRLGNGLERVNSLLPKSFILNHGDGSRRTGLIAQDVDKNPLYGSNYVSREEQTTDNPDPLMSLDYASFVPDLIAAVKELSARVVQLEAQMESLKTW